MKKNNLRPLVVPSLFITLAALSQTASAVVILGGSTGNADFQATTAYPNGGGNTAPFDNVANWVNIGGGENPTSFGAANQLNLSPDPAHDPKQGAFLSVGNEAANTTGYTIGAAGEVFDASLFLAATGGAAGYGDADTNAPGNGNLDDETVTIFLFTAPAAVDGTTALANITRLASASFDLDRLVAGTETANSLYTSTAGDIGETIYFGIELLNPTGNNPFPRIDLVTLEVTPIPEPSSVALLGLGLLGLTRRRR
ncbi:MAG: PEP-CTERM sorting domain-containing protein [Roseibacillus sp.]